MATFPTSRLASMSPFTTSSSQILSQEASSSRCCCMLCPSPRPPHAVVMYLSIVWQPRWPTPSPHAKLLRWAVYACLTRVRKPSERPAYLSGMMQRGSIPPTLSSWCVSPHAQRYGPHLDSATRVDPNQAYAVRWPTAHPIHENFRVHAFRQVKAVLPCFCSFFCCA